MSAVTGQLDSSTASAAFTMPPPRQTSRRYSEAIAEQLLAASEQMTPFLTLWLPRGYGVYDCSGEISVHVDEQFSTGTRELCRSTTAGDSGTPERSAVTVTGPESTDNEVAAIIDALAAFGDANNLDIAYIGDTDWAANLDTQVQAGSPPDISIFPQPALLADHARAGDLTELPSDVIGAVTEAWSDDWLAFGNVDGAYYGVPVKADLKSLVWYQPARFAALGYEVPETFDEFTALLDKAAADGHRPLCVGIESGAATGWPFTDWVEDMVLRQHGPDVYDQWVTNDIGFTDPRIVESMQTVVDLWAPDKVHSSTGSIATTSFDDSAAPLVNGDCLMHRQANFFAAFIHGAPFADNTADAVDVFYFPDIHGDRPVLVAGALAAAFNDDPATLAVIEYMGTTEYAEARQRAQAPGIGGLSGFLSAASGQDTSVYSPLERSFLAIFDRSEVARFDGSDLMPAAVNVAFWQEGTALINGEKTAAEAALAIQAAWD